MNFCMPEAELFVPDGTEIVPALERTTHLGVGAHPDDLEIMAIDGILKCFRRDDRWFTGIVVTDGAGGPRAKIYQEASGEEMRRVRATEQKEAANMGKYAAVALLAHPSERLKDPGDSDCGEDLRQLLEAAQPEVVYTHNLADKHNAHVATALETIAAIRGLEPDRRPNYVLGCEVWRDLDWLPDEKKVLFDCSIHETLQSRLLETFQSQIGIKRYDLATMGRRQANATYHESQESDKTTGLSFGMDLTPLIQDGAMDPVDFAVSLADAFKRDVRDRLTRLRRRS